MIRSLRVITLLCCMLLSPAQAQQNIPPGYDIATFAGGCFWCMEPPYDEIPGVISTTSGYIGGQKKNPTYEEVSSGRTGHTEAVQVVYDPKKVSYQKLLDVFWMNIDPTTPNAAESSTPRRRSIPAIPSRSIAARLSRDSCLASSARSSDGMK